MLNNNKEKLKRKYVRRKMPELRRFSGLAQLSVF